jgi:hypothetical protein
VEEVRVVQVGVEEVQIAPVVEGLERVQGIGVVVTERVGRKVAASVKTSQVYLRALVQLFVWIGLHAPMVLMVQKVLLLVLMV